MSGSLVGRPRDARGRLLPLPPEQRKHSYFYCEASLYCNNKFTPDLPSPTQPGGGIVGENFYGESRVMCWVHAKKYLEAF